MFDIAALTPAELEPILMSECTTPHVLTGSHKSLTGSYKSRLT